MVCALFFVCLIRLRIKIFWSMVFMACGLTVRLGFRVFRDFDDVFKVCLG